MNDKIASLQSDGWLWLDPSSQYNLERILTNLGAIIPSRRARADYHDLPIYVGNEAPRRSMSALVGPRPQPMHTDSAYLPTPPRYIALKCINPGEASCPTHIWSLDVKRMSAQMPEILTSPTWIVRGGGAFNAFYSSILEKVDTQLRIRFDSCCMIPINRNKQIVTDSHQLIKSYSLHREFHWEKGAALVIDNWRCLHARGIGGDRAPSRILRRWLIGGVDGLVR